MARKQKLNFKSYPFQGKDPVLRILRVAILKYAGRRRIELMKALGEISELTGVSVSCMYNWLHGETVSPRFCYAAAVGIMLDVPEFKGFDIRTAPQRRALLRLVSKAA